MSAAPITTIRESLSYALYSYSTAKLDLFKANPMAKFFRHEFPTAIRKYLVDYDDFFVKGSAGNGNWSDSPWVAVLDPLITDSTMRGYYPVYLFAENFSRVYLSLNQGVTVVREHYKANARDALKARAFDFRARLGKLPGTFTTLPLKLERSNNESLSAFYEAGNICSIEYEAGRMPGESTLVNDLMSILAAYRRLNDSTLDMDSAAVEDDEAGLQFEEDHTKIKRHKRIERNPAVAKAVKKAQGYKCKACGFDFEAVYGVVGSQYIEAHHLIPISNLAGTKVQRDPIKDFAVLCSNCHRMIHRLEDTVDVQALTKLINAAHLIKA